MAPIAGQPVRVEMTKWGERPHWHFAGFFLGEDEHGQWLGFPQGTHNSRPGFAFDSEVACVTLLPHADALAGGWFAATFHSPGIWCDLYVDIATPVTWEGLIARSVDLDLDVIRMAPSAPPSSPLAPQNQLAGWGEIFVDDEDEFAEHQVEYAYPADVIANAQAACDAVLAAARGGTAPFDGTHQRWAAELQRLTR